MRGDEKWQLVVEGGLRGRWVANLVPRSPGLSVSGQSTCKSMWHQINVAHFTSCQYTSYLISSNMSKVPWTAKKMQFFPHKQFHRRFREASYKKSSEDVIAQVTITCPLLVLFCSCLLSFNLVFVFLSVRLFPLFCLKITLTKWRRGIKSEKSLFVSKF